MEKLLENNTDKELVDKIKKYKLNLFRNLIESKDDLINKGLFEEQEIFKLVKQLFENFNLTDDEKIECAYSVLKKYKFDQNGLITNTEDELENIDFYNRIASEIISTLKDDNKKRNFLETNCKSGFKEYGTIISSFNDDEEKFGLMVKYISGNRAYIINYDIDEASYSKAKVLSSLAKNEDSDRSKINYIETFFMGKEHNYDDEISTCLSSLYNQDLKIKYLKLIEKPNAKAKVIGSLAGKKYDKTKLDELEGLINENVQDYTIEQAKIQLIIGIEDDFLKQRILENQAKNYDLKSKGKIIESINSDELKENLINEYFGNFENDNQKWILKYKLLNTLKDPLKKFKIYINLKGMSENWL